MSPLSDQKKKESLPGVSFEADPSTGSLPKRPASLSELVMTLRAVKADKRYLENITHGTPRPGHPEGTVKAHIYELERNLRLIDGYLKSSAERLSLTPEELVRAEIFIHVHDSFKKESKPGVPIAHPQSHASLAREFLAGLTTDGELLEVVQNHDVPWALFRKDRLGNSLNSERFRRLETAITDWDFFLLCQVIDGTTLGKVSSKGENQVSAFCQLMKDRVSLKRDYKELHETLKAFLLRLS